MPSPIIVLTTGRENRKPAEGEVQLVFTGCDLCYVDAIVRAGGAPVLLPRHDDPLAIRAAIEIADGVLFTGGGDVSSLTYGQEPHPKLAQQDPVRDAQEIEAARIAIGRDIPVLGICRGIQLLNVALGGTLIQDIPTQVPSALLHYSHAAAPLTVHTIDIEPDTILAKLQGCVELPVNSYHHQAIERLGDGLRVNARSGIPSSKASNSPTASRSWPSNTTPKSCPGSIAASRSISIGLSRAPANISPEKPKTPPTKAPRTGTRIRRRSASAYDVSAAHVCGGT